MIEWLSGFGKDDVFLDVGANVGIYTVPAATLAGRVIAVELDPSNVGILYENCFLNKLTEKVVIVPLGVGDRNSVELVYYRDFSKGDALQSVARPSPFQTRTTRQRAQMPSGHRKPGQHLRYLRPAAADQDKDRRRWQRARRLRRRQESDPGGVRRSIPRTARPRTPITSWTACTRRGSR